MKIHIAGGGPAGLYFAMLMKQADPAHDVTIWERDGPNDTFGWGIVFSGRTMAFLRDADPHTHAQITEKFQTWDNVDIVLQGNRVRVHGNRFSSIQRLAFVNIFQKRCEELGVKINYRTTVNDSDLEWLQECDLLVGCDGANSMIRRNYADHFEPTVELGKNHFIWLGTPHIFDGMTLTFRGHATGDYAAHSYKFSDRLSTFIAECSGETFDKAGFESMDESETIRTLREIFADDLKGATLLTNNFLKWIRFPHVTNQRWHHGHTVLLGDALHTAHFSIGSGTKLAVEDSIALFRAFEQHSDVPAALKAFEISRRPEVESLQSAAVQSQHWFETVSERMLMDPIPFAMSCMCRSGRIDMERMQRDDPQFVAAFENWKATHGK